MLKVVSVNHDRIVAENGVKEFIQKLRARQAKRAYKMLFQEQAKSKTNKKQN